MKKLAAWIGVNLVLLVLGTVFRFGHFWQRWEFLAAATAAAYNLFFSYVGYAYAAEPGGKTLSKTLQAPFYEVLYLCLRVSVPSLMFLASAALILGDRHVGKAPVDPADVVLKLVMTFLAFTAIWLGDTLTERHLRMKLGASDGELRWAQHLRRHAWLIDLPLVVGYLGLTLLYIGHRYGTEEELLLQAFIGGASALEMLILSAVHGFAELADHKKQALVPSM